MRPIGLGILANVIEAGITLASPARPPPGSTFSQTTQHGFHRRVQAVEVEAVKPHLFSIRRKRLVVCPQPRDELDHHRVAPHPSWKATKIGERFLGIDVIAHAANITVRPDRRRANLIHRDGREVFFDYRAAS